jgi:hypothetical protein
MANAKLSGSLLERKDVLPSTTLALSEPSDASVNGSLANRFESVNAALCDADSKDAPSAQAMTAAGRSVSCSPTGEGNRRFATIIAFCGFAATISGFLFFHATTQTGPTVASQSPSSSPKVRDAMRAPTDLATPPHITIATSSEADIVPATIIPPRPDASVTPAIPLAVADPAVPSAETAVAIRAPGPSAELPASPAGVSAPVNDPRPAVALARAESPPQAILVPSIAAPPAPQPSPAVEAVQIAPRLEPVVAGNAVVPAMQAAGARIPTEEIAALLARGDVLFGKGDITSARLFYERAAEEGDAQAAMRLGESYDAAFLARARLNGVSGDAASALRWYRYARELEAVKGEILLTGVAVDDEVAKRSKEMNQLFEQFLALSKQRR